mgnify:FL=1
MMTKLDHGEPMYDEIKPADLDALDALRVASVHRSKWASYNSALHNAYPAMAAELRALREEVVKLKDDLCDAEELRQKADAIRDAREKGKS